MRIIRKLIIFLLIVIIQLFSHHYLFSQVEAEGYSARAPFKPSRIESDTARFSIVFPGNPFHADKRESIDEEFKREIFFQKDNVNNEITYYAIASIVKEKHRPANPAKYIKKKADSYHIKWGGDPVKNNKIEYEGIGGREIENHLNDKYNMRVRLFYRDSIYYEFTLVGPPDSINTRPGNQFYESLEFTD
jgi:hypothetical protein